MAPKEYLSRIKRAMKLAAFVGNCIFGSFVGSFDSLVNSRSDIFRGRLFPEKGKAHGLPGKVVNDYQSSPAGDICSRESKF